MSPLTSPASSPTTSTLGSLATPTATPTATPPSSPINSRISNSTSSPVTSTVENSTKGSFNTPGNQRTPTPKRKFSIRKVGGSSPQDSSSSESKLNLYPRSPPFSSSSSSSGSPRTSPTSSPTAHPQHNLIPIQISSPIGYSTNTSTTKQSFFRRASKTLSDSPTSSPPYSPLAHSPTEETTLPTSFSSSSSNSQIPYIKTNQKIRRTAGSAPLTLLKQHSPRLDTPLSAREGRDNKSRKKVDDLGKVNLSPLACSEEYPEHPLDILFEFIEENPQIACGLKGIRWPKNKEIGSGQEDRLENIQVILKDILSFFDNKISRSDNETAFEYYNRLCLYRSLISHIIKYSKKTENKDQKSPIVFAENSAAIPAGTLRSEVLGSSPSFIEGLPVNSPDSKDEFCEELPSEFANDSPSTFSTSEGCTPAETAENSKDKLWSILKSIKIEINKAVENITNLSDYQNIFNQLNEKTYQSIENINHIQGNPILSLFYLSKIEKKYIKPQNKKIYKAFNIYKPNKQELLLLILIVNDQCPDKVFQVLLTLIQLYTYAQRLSLSDVTTFPGNTLLIPEEEKFTEDFYLQTSNIIASCIATSFPLLIQALNKSLEKVGYDPFYIREKKETETASSSSSSTTKELKENLSIYSVDPLNIYFQLDEIRNNLISNGKKNKKKETLLIQLKKILQAMRVFRFTIADQLHIYYQNSQSETVTEPTKNPAQNQLPLALSIELMISEMCQNIEKKAQSGIEDPPLKSYIEEKAADLMIHIRGKGKLTWEFTVAYCNTKPRRAAHLCCLVKKLYLLFRKDPLLNSPDKKAPGIKRKSNSIVFTLNRALEDLQELIKIEEKPIKIEENLFFEEFCEEVWKIRCSSTKEDSEMLDLFMLDLIPKEYHIYYLQHNSQATHISEQFILKFQEIWIPSFDSIENPNVPPAVPAGVQPSEVENVEGESFANSEGNSSQNSSSEPGELADNPSMEKGDEASTSDLRVPAGITDVSLTTPDEDNIIDFIFKLRYGEEKNSPFFRRSGLHVKLLTGNIIHELFSKGSDGERLIAIILKDFSKIETNHEGDLVKDFIFLESLTRVKIKKQKQKQKKTLMSYFINKKPDKEIEVEHKPLDNFLDYFIEYQKLFVDLIFQKNLNWLKKHLTLMILCSQKKGVPICKYDLISHLYLYSLCVILERKRIPYSGEAKEDLFFNLLLRLLNKCFMLLPTLVKEPYPSNEQMLPFAQHPEVKELLKILKNIIDDFYEQHFGIPKSELFVNRGVLEQVNTKPQEEEELQVQLEDTSESSNHENDPQVGTDTQNDFNASLEGMTKTQEKERERE